MLMQPGRPNPPCGFDLEDFFVGRATGRGVFKSWINQVNRGFSIEATGSFDGQVLTLREDFHFDDGEEDSKTWIFTKTGTGVYTGQREGLVGVADVRVEKSRVTMGYTLDLPDDKGKSIRLRFDDTLTLIAPGEVLNTARVSKFFIPVASVSVTFKADDHG